MVRVGNMEISVSNSALLLVDIQNDFLPGGALAVPNGHEVVDAAMQAVIVFRNLDRPIIATKDSHPENHVSFASTHERPVFSQIELLDGTTQTMWPRHCVTGSAGWNIPGRLVNTASTGMKIVRKGEDPNIDSYSGFWDNGRKKSTKLDGILQELAIKNLFVMGLATDFCVKYTVLDALQLGYNVFVIASGCRAVNLTPGDDVKAYEEMRAKGASILFNVPSTKTVFEGDVLAYPDPVANRKDYIW